MTKFSNTRKHAPIKCKDGMNKTEAEYARELEALKYNGEIEGYVYEPMKLRLADKTTYTPDFLVIHLTHFEFHEVKGFERDDAIVKFKVAAEMFPWFRFLMVKKEGKHFKITRDSHDTPQPTQNRQETKVSGKGYFDNASCTNCVWRGVKNNVCPQCPVSRKSEDIRCIKSKGVL